jgi:ribosomal protein S6--L-glutamate ligase
MHSGRYYVLEGNMKYGRQGFRQAGIDYTQLMSQLIQQGEI